MVLDQTASGTNWEHGQIGHHMKFTLTFEQPKTNNKFLAEIDTRLDCMNLTTDYLHKSMAICNKH